MLLATEIDSRTNGAKQLPEVEQTESGDDQGPTREQIFEVLANERRRYVLGYLEHSDNGTVELRTLVTQVAALENDVPPGKLDSDDRKSVYVGLRQTHLPKMDQYNLVDYDPDRGEVELTDAARRAQLYLEYIPENDIPWAYHYVGLSVLLAIITGLVWLQVFPFAGLGGLVTAGLIVGAFGLSAVVHTVYTHRNRLGYSIQFDEG